MTYSLNWKDVTLPYTQKANPISVPTGSIVSNAASIRFTGNGAPNYGKVVQENLMQMLEHFASGTEPLYPTVGQLWYDTDNLALKLCTDTAPSALTWKTLNGIKITEVGDPTPTGALGDLWIKKIGDLSSIVYNYTGVGRYPKSAFDTVDFYPDTNVTTLAAKNDFSAFSTAETGAIFISGRTAGVQANIDGTILIVAAVTAVTKGTAYAKYPNNGYLLWDTAANLGTINPSSTPITTEFYCVRQLENSEWEYDNGETWVNFSPVATEYLIGTYTCNAINLGTGTVISASTVWDQAQPVWEYTKIVNSATGALGGWEQVFPENTIVGGRMEFDSMAEQLLNLCGDPLTFGGYGDVPTDLAYKIQDILNADTNLRYLWLSSGDDAVYSFPYRYKLKHLQSDIDSQDWDILLAWVRFCVYRLELPTDTLDTVSHLPFISDGLQTDPLFIAYTGILQPTDKTRYARTKPGIMTMINLYQETVNILNAARENRYLIKGIMGSSGTNASFGSSVTNTLHKAFTADTSDTEFTSIGAINGLKFVFNNTNLNARRFLGSGQAVELVLSYAIPGSPTANDTNFNNVCNNYGRIRITAKDTFVFNKTGTALLSMAPTTVGVFDYTASDVTLVTITGGAATITLTATLNINDFVIHCSVITGGSTSGTLTATWNLIEDSSIDTSMQPVAWSSGHNQDDTGTIFS